MNYQTGPNVSKHPVRFKIYIIPISSKSIINYPQSMPSRNIKALIAQDTQVSQSFHSNLSKCKRKSKKSKHLSKELLIQNSKEHYNIKINRTRLIMRYYHERDQILKSQIQTHTERDLCFQTSRISSPDWVVASFSIQLQSSKRFKRKKWENE